MESILSTSPSETLINEHHKMTVEAKFRQHQ